MINSQFTIKEKAISQEFAELSVNFRPVFGLSDHISLAELLGDIAVEEKKLEEADSRGRKLDLHREKLVSLKSQAVFLLRKIRDNTADELIKTKTF